MNTTRNTITCLLLLVIYSSCSPRSYREIKGPVKIQRKYFPETTTSADGIKLNDSAHFVLAETKKYDPHGLLTNYYTSSGDTTTYDISYRIFRTIIMIKGDDSTSGKMVIARTWPHRYTLRRSYSNGQKRSKLRIKQNSDGKTLRTIEKVSTTRSANMDYKRTGSYSYTPYGDKIISTNNYHKRGQKTSIADTTIFNIMVLQKDEYGNPIIQTVFTNKNNGRPEIFEYEYYQ